jgi:hypothetical protein
MSIRALLGGVLSIGVLAATTPTLAQVTKAPSTQPEWLLVTLVSVNPGSGPDYVALQTSEVMPAQKKGSTTGRQAWSSGIAGTPGEFVFISPIKSFAQFDGPSPMVTALGEQGAAALGAKSAKLVQTTKRMIVRTRPDLSYRPNPGAAPTALALITVVDVVPGRRSEFEAFMKKDVVPAMQQAKVKGYSVLEVVYGDSIGTYLTAVGYDSYEQIGNGHPFQIALGEEGARKLEAKVAGIISHVDRFISRYRPDLSWMPESGTK